MAKQKEKLRILFIGNSHTYYNDMPLLVQRRALEEQFDCEVTMLAHGGWYLKQHVDSPDVRFNIQYGRYDYVVLQEHTHPFEPVEDYYEAAEVLNQWITQAGSRTVLYMTWAKKDDKAGQKIITDVNRDIAAKTGALLAPVGENWWSYMHSWPDLEMYNADGEHASLAGSDFAAKLIYETIHMDWYRRRQTQQR